MNAVIVVNSCDAYSDLWDIFLLCLEDYWGDCPYPIVINAETKKYVPPPGLNFDVSVHNYGSGEQDRWGERLRGTLRDLDADFVIMLYDDFFLDARVDQNRVADLVARMASERSIDVIYLTKMLGVEKESEEVDGLSAVKRSAEYRLNSCPAVWRKEALLAYTGSNDNPWAWEYFGSYRTYGNGRTFLAVAEGVEDVYPYDYRKGGAIYRGKWVSEVIDPIIERHGLLLDVNARGRVGQDDSPKRDLSWKISFLMTGVRMIGAKMFLVVYRLLRRKLV